jgi:hypothetical protein
MEEYSNFLYKNKLSQHGAKSGIVTLDYYFHTATDLEDRSRKTTTKDN